MKKKSESKTKAGSRLTHLKDGQLHMVDVGGKDETERVATAAGEITVSAAAMKTIRTEGLKKGDLITTAKVAGVLAAKKVPGLIPLAHPIRITGIDVDIKAVKTGFIVTATVKTLDRTGVEIEAMTAALVALLTIYDMAKAIDRTMEIGQVRLLKKSGGRSGTFVRGV